MFVTLLTVANQVTTPTALLIITDEPQTVSKHLMAGEYEKKNDTHSVRLIHLEGWICNSIKLQLLYIYIYQQEHDLNLSDKVHIGLY